MAVVALSTGCTVQVELSQDFDPAFMVRSMDNMKALIEAET